MVRKRKTTPNLFKCLLFWLVPLVSYADYPAPEGYSNIPIPIRNRVYHLMFVTEGAIDATSPDIETYNAFAQAEAERTDDLPEGFITGAVSADWGLDWYAIVSTPEISARENVLTQGIVYDFNGHYRSIFGSNYSSLWQGYLASGKSVDITQYKDYVTDTKVWTGSSAGGLRGLVMGSDSGQSYVGSTNPSYGSPEEWIAFWQGNRPQELEFPIYAVSGPIINGEPVEFLDGDFNGNGTVEQGDLDLVLRNWVTTNPNFRDGLWYHPESWTYKPPIRQVGQDYLDEVLLNWGNTRFTPPQPFSIPEPSAGRILFAVLLVGWLYWQLEKNNR